MTSVWGRRRGGFEQPRAGRKPGMTEQRTPIQARIPSATYRVQFNRDFGFEAATELVDYWHELGITDCYASPLLTARPGSTHGYDVIDHTRLNPELGDFEQFARFARELRKRDMGLIVDVVPNHMCISDTGNHWWRDVLENGPSSAYARFFDIDWRPPKSDLANKVLLPVLGDQYGRVLENQEIRIYYAEGSFCAWYWEMSFPLAPRTWRWILEPALRILRERTRDEGHALELESILYALEHLPTRTETDRHKLRAREREKEFIKRRLRALVDENPVVREAIEASLTEINGQKGMPRSFDRLESLLADQAYRLSFWRVASHEINYRRFFDVNELAAIRVEENRVFNAVHGLIFRLMKQGFVTGLRIDHIDGLLEPARYLESLQRSAFAALHQAQGAPELNPREKLAAAVEHGGQDFRPCYILVEKILQEHESLRPEWPVHGTTGYEFMNLVNDLFVDPSAAQVFRALYQRFTGSSADLADVVYDSKKLILKVSLSSELHVMARRLDRISEQHRYSRDFTFASLHDAMKEFVTCFPVYRTYITRSDQSVRPEDRVHLDATVRGAIRRNPATSRSIYDFLHSLFMLQDPEGLDETERAERREFVLKLQQLTGPVMAKGVEDTAYYRVYPLASLNEVGGEPQRFGLTITQFHKFNLTRLATWPHALSAGSTHDTKRSEDVRARINVLSEIPNEWERAVYRWREINRPKRTVLSDESVAPGDNDEYLFYQTLIGAWPFGKPTEKSHAEFVTRIKAYMEKATKEAKVNTSWVNPNEEYDRGLAQYIEQVLDSQNHSFLDDFRRFHAPVGRAGMFNSLSQTVLRIACPGVPDFYQGTEMWDFSLVDPDNRRPVDYAKRRRALADVVQAAAVDRAALMRQLLETAENGRLKLYVIWAALNLRKRCFDLFAKGDYLPLRTQGLREEHAIAFARRDSQHCVLVVAGRFFLGLGVAEQLPVGEPVWGNTAVVLEGEEFAGTYRDVFSGQHLRVSRRDLSKGVALAQAFAYAPVAMLEKVEPSGGHKRQ